LKLRASAKPDFRMTPLGVVGFAFLLTPVWTTTPCSGEFGASIRIEKSPDTAVWSDESGVSVYDDDDEARSTESGSAALSITPGLRFVRQVEIIVARCETTVEKTTSIIELAPKQGPPRFRFCG